MRRIALAAILVVVSLPLFATEPNPTARQRVLVEKLLEVTSANRIGLTMMDAMFVEIEKQFVANAEAKGNRPEDVAEAKELFAAFRDKASKMDLAGLMQESNIRIYSKYFTEKELEELIAFYSTPIGKKTIEVTPQLAREGVETGAREVGPKIEQIMTEVMAEHEKKRPWRRTMLDMRSVASAIEAYAVDNDELYPTGDYASLKSTLSEYIDEFPEKDIWEHEYAYVVSTDQKHYRLVSAGADSIFDWDSRRIVAPKSGAETEKAIAFRDRLESETED